MTVSQSNESTATVTGACEICSIAAHTIRCSNEVHVQRVLWQKWKDFNDHFDYYIYRVKFHYIICVQRRDTQASLAIDLVVNQVTKAWHIRVQEAEWKPGNWRVHTSKHKWHAAAALKAVHKFATDFDKWAIIANNCKTFAKGVVGFMSDSENRTEYECEPITDDFDRLSSFGASIGVELMYMTSKEAVQSIPSQEEGEEEPLDSLDYSDTLAAAGGEEDRHRELTTNQEGVQLCEDEGQKQKEEENMERIVKINNETAI